MKAKGSYTVEMALVMPMVLLLFVGAIRLGIVLHTETAALVQELEEEKEISVAESIYHMETAAELWGIFYGD